jgi:hypothetical protein
MADGKKFTHQLFDVQMLDGTEYLDIPITHADRIAGEAVANKHKWGDDQPMRLVSFWVWSSLRRTGRISRDVVFEKWLAEINELERQKEDEEVDPTQETDTSD